MTATNELHLTTVDFDTGLETINVIRGGDEKSRRAEATRQAAKALRKGHMVIHPSGVKVFHERVVRFNPKAETSSGRYEWSDDGNRVRADIIEHRIHPDGTENSEIVKQVWVKR